MDNVKKNIDLAKKIINNEIDELFSYIYPFTTENIKGYYDLLDFSNKNVLTVGSSGDHTLNLYLKNVSSVDYFDINPFCEYYFDLKRKAIEHLEYDEFLDFFCYNDYPKLLKNNNKAFSISTYYKILPYLNDDTKFFWDSLYIDNMGIDIRKSDLFSKDEKPSKVLTKTNLYLEPNNYYKLKDLLPFCQNSTFYNSNIYDINLNKKYDIIMLSNIPSYLEYIYVDNYLENFHNLILKLEENLNDEGIILLSYLYDINHNVNFINGPIIYNLEEVNKYFKYETLKFKGIENILYHQQNPIKDAVLVYKKTK